MLALSVFVILISSCLFFSTDADYPFNDPSLSWSSRVDDLVSRLTAEEIIGQMSHGGGAQRGDPTPPIPRLNIKPYAFDTECIHGVVLNNATCFPQSIALAATFSKTSVHDVAQAISYEARAFYNSERKKGRYGYFRSISCFAPFINILRHPLWGRIQEIYGEDPFLSGEIAAAYVNGLQGHHERYVRASSGCKVVSAHSGPENIPVSRFSFNAKVTERDMRLTYLPNVKACIEAGTYNLMCSYNSINGIPACADTRLLKNVFRNEYGFKGYYVSDMGAIEYIMTQHHYVSTVIDAAAVAVNAGVNLELPPGGPVFFNNLTQALKLKKVSMETLKERAKPLFYTRMRLGEFDPPDMNPYNKIDTDVIQSLTHLNVARKAAADSFVLLKNINKALPLKVLPLESLALIGPMINNSVQQYGSYAPLMMPEFISTPASELRKLAKTTFLVEGCNDNHCKKYDEDSVKNAVIKSNLIILCLGTGFAVESEGLDRADMNLPGFQETLLKDVVSSANGRKIILLLFSAGPLNINWAYESENIQAILQVWFPGQETGTALIDSLAIINGKVKSPGGRLPYTWPKSLAQVPPMTDYSMKNRTYRYNLEKPLFPFGFGLSYTKFQYSDLVIDEKTISNKNESMNLKFKVTNVGTYSGDEVSQVYIIWLDTKEDMPFIQLVAFERFYEIAPSTTVQAKIQVSAEKLMVWTDNGFILENGRIKVFVSGQQPEMFPNTGANILTQTLVIQN